MDPNEIGQNQDDIDMLARKYPAAFKNLSQDIYHFIPSGWVSHVDNLFKDINPIVEEHLSKHPSTPEEYPFSILQIKEKFGGLRIYFMTNSEDDTFHKQIRDLVDRAEDVSYTICEVTGRPGKLCRNSGIYKTYCEELYTKYGFEVLGNGNS
jgi:hypothetical protein